MPELNQLNAEHFDVLKEIGNIGAGNAATSMGKMINQKLAMQVPSVNFLAFSEVAEAINGAENIVAGILISFTGDVNGMMMFILEEHSACQIIKTMMGRDKKSFAEFDEIDLSAVQETGNIMAGGYMGAIASMTGLKFRQSVPFISIDMAGAILSVPAIEFGKIADGVLFIESSFIGQEQDVKGYFILIPELESFETILKALGVM